MHTRDFRCIQMHFNSFTWGHEHTYTHTSHKQPFWLKQASVSLLSSAKKRPSREPCPRIWLCVCVCVLFIPSDTTWLLCFTGHYIVWHMGFARLLCPGNKAKQAASEWSLWVWCIFHQVQLSLMLAERNWGTGQAPLTGSPAPVLGRFVVCCFLVPLLGQQWSLGEQVVTMSQCDRQPFSEQLPHMQPCSRFPFINLQRFETFLGQIILYSAVCGALFFVIALDDCWSVLVK